MGGRQEMCALGLPIAAHWLDESLVWTRGCSPNDRRTKSCPTSLIG